MYMYVILNNNIFVVALISGGTAHSRYQKMWNAKFYEGYVATSLGDSLGRAVLTHTARGHLYTYIQLWLS